MKPIRIYNTFLPNNKDIGKNKPILRYFFLAMCLQLLALQVVFAQTPTAPTVTISSPTTPQPYCGGVEVTLNATGAGAGMEYRWYELPTDGTFLTTGDGGSNYTISSPNGATFSMLSLSYNITFYVAVYDPVANRESARTPIALTVSPEAIILEGLTVGKCGTSTFNLTTNDQGAGAVYRWFRIPQGIPTPQAVPAAQGGNTRQITISNVGLYYVEVTKAGCKTTSLTTQVQDTYTPTTAIIETGSNNFCEGDNLTLNAVFDRGARYQWKKDGVNIAGETQTFYRVTSSGSYTVRIQIGGCSAESTPKVIDQTAIDQPKITNPSPVNACFGGQVVLNSSTTSTGVTYQWQYGFTSAGTFATADGASTSATYTATKAGFYKVQISKSTCSRASDPVEVVILPLPTATINQGTSTSFCTNQTVPLTTDFKTGEIYYWTYSSNGTTFTSVSTSKSASNTTINADKEGFYKLVATRTDCNTTAEAVIITEETKSVITTADPAEFCKTKDVTLTGQNISGATYQWQSSFTTASGPFTNIAGETNLTYKASQAGFYRLSVNKNGCTVFSSAITAKEKEAKIDNGLPTSFCVGQTATLTANLIVGATYQWFRVPLKAYSNPVTQILGVTGNVLTVSAEASYQVRINDPSGCTNTSPFVDVTQTPDFKPVFSQTSPQKFCKGGNVPLDVTVDASVGAPDKYEWIYSTDANFTAGANTFTTGSNTEIFNPSAAKAGFYKVKVTKGQCTLETPAMTLEEQPTIPKPVISPTSPATICSTGSLGLSTTKSSSYTYQWKKAADDNDPNSTYSNISGATTDFLSVSTKGYYKVEVSQTGCGKDISDAVKVNPYDPATAVKPKLINGGVKLVCNNAIFNLEVNTGSATTYKWFYSTTSGGAYSFITSAPNKEIYSATASSATIGFYFCQVTQSNGCVENTDIVEIQLTTKLPKATVTSPQTLCAGGTGLTLSSSENSPSYSYQWQFTNDISKPFANVTGGTQAKLANVNNTGFYKMIITPTVTGCEGNESDVITVIDAGSGAVPVLAQSSPLSFCVGGDVAIQVKDAALSATYKWTYSKDNTTYTLATESPNNVAQILATKDGYYKVDVTDGSCVTTLGAVRTIEKTTQDKPTTDQAGTITLCPASQTATIKLLTMQCTGCEYQWQVSKIKPVSPSFSSYTNISGETGVNFTTSTTGYYRVRVDSKKCGIAFSDDIYIIESGGTATSYQINQSSPVAICGGSTDLDINKVGNATYQWQVSDTETGTFANVATAGNSNKYTVSTMGKYYRVGINEGTCVSYSNAVLVEAVSATSKATITMPSPSAALCTNGKVTLKASPKGAGDYRWERKPGAAGVYSQILGVNTDSLVVNATGFTYRVRVTCGTQTLISNEVVVPATDPSSVPSTPIALTPAGSDITFCLSGGTTLATSIAAQQFTWVKSTDGLTFDKNLGKVGFNKESLQIVNNASTGTGFYKLIATINGCEYESEVKKVTSVTAMPKPIIDPVSGSNLCNTGNITLKVSNGIANYSYLWKYKANDGVATFTNASGANTGQTYLATQSGIYTVDMSDANTSGSCGIATSDAFTLTDPIGTVLPTITPNPSAFCKDATTQLTTTAIVGATYIWKYSKDGTAPYTVATGNTSASKYETNVAGSYIVVVKQGGCEYTTPAVAVTSQASMPDPVIDAITELCGNNTAALTVQNASNAYAYSWQFKASVSAAFAAAKGTNNLSTYTATESGFYQVTVSSPTCGTKTAAAIVALSSVTGTPTIAVEPQYCSPSGAKVSTTYAVGTSGYVYQWAYAPSATAPYSNILGVNASFIYVKNTGFYKLTVFSPEGCVLTATPVNVTSVVATKPVVYPQSANPNLCSNGTLKLTTNVPVNPTITFTWLYSPNGTVYNNASGTNNAATYNATAEGFYKIRVSSASCPVQDSDPLKVNAGGSVALPKINNGDETAAYCVEAGYGSVQISTDGIYDSYAWKVDFTSSGVYTAAPSAKNIESYNVTKKGTYIVEVTKDGCTYASSPITVIETTSTPKPKVTVDGKALTSAALCANNTITLSLDTKSALYSYQWKELVGSAYVDIAGATSTTYTATKAGSYTVRVISKTCQPAESDPISISPAIAGGTPASIVQKSPVEFCVGGDIDIWTQEGAVSYQWQSRANATDVFANISGQTNFKLNVKTAGEYRVIVKTGGCTETTTAVTVNSVSGTPKPTIAPVAPVSLCSDGKISLQSLSTSSSYIYLWQFATVGSTSFAPASGTNNKSTYTGTQTGNYRLQVTGCTPVTTATSDVLIVDPFSGGASPVILQDKGIALEVCKNAGLLLETTPIASASYKWKFSNTATGTFTDAGGINTQSSYTTQNAGFYKVEITSGGCVVNTSAVEVKFVDVMPKPITEPVGATELCSDGSKTLFVLVYSPSYSYKWQYKATATAAFADQGTGRTLTTSKIGFYQVVATASCGTAHSDAIILSAASAGAVPATIVQKSPAEFCVGGDIDIWTQTGFASYQWQSRPNATAAFADIAGQTNFKLNVRTAGEYRVVVKNSGCSETTAAIVVNSVVGTPKPKIAPTAPVTLCSDGKISLQSLSTSSSYTYLWQFATVGSTNFTAASGTNNQATYTASKSGSYRLQITGCTPVSTSVSDALTVDPYSASALPTILQDKGVAVEVCKGSALLLETNPSSTATYKWKFSTTSTGTFSNASGTNNQATYTASEAGFYKLEVNASGCLVVTNALEVKLVDVMPKPIIEPVGNADLCSDGKKTISVLVFSPSYTYRWQVKSTPAGAFADAGITGRTLTATKSGIYQVIASASCGTANSDQIQITAPSGEPPVAEILQGKTVTFCATGDVILDANTGTGYLYKWKYSSDGTTYTDAPGTNDKVSYAADRGGFLKVEVRTEGCPVLSEPTQVIAATVMPPAYIAEGNQATFCLGFPGIMNALSKGSKYNYTWKYSKSIGGPYQGVGNGVTFVTSLPGFYVLDISQDGCGSSSASPLELIISKESPKASILQGKTANYCKGGDVLLEGDFQKGYTYEWLFATKIDDPFTAAPGAAYERNYKASRDGFYKVKVTVNQSCQSVSDAIEVKETTSMPQAIIFPNENVGFCEGEKVLLEAKTKGAGFVYEWAYATSRGGNYEILADNVDKYSVATAGFYRLKISKQGCGSTTAEVQVSQTTNKPNSVIVQGTLASFCNEGTALLEAQTLGGYNYEWYYSANKTGNYTKLDTGARYNAKTQGFYKLKTLYSGCSSFSEPIEVQRVTSIPQATILQGGLYGFCTGQVSVINSKFKGSGYKYLWLYSPTANGEFTTAGGNGSLSSDLEVSRGGFYKIRVSQDGCGTTESGAIQMLEVTLLPTAAIEQGVSLRVCEGDNFQLSAKETPLATYSWTGPDGFKASGRTITVRSPTVARSTGNYRLTTEITGCRVTANIFVQVAGKPKFTVEKSGIICVGEQNGIINVSTTDNSDPLQYKLGADGKFQTETTFTGLKAGNYTVIAKNSNCETAIATTVIESDNTNTGVSISSPETTSAGTAEIFRGKSTQLTATGGINYTWTPTTGLSDPKIANPIARPTETTVYTVKASGINGCGTAKITVKVNINYSLAASSNVLSPNGDNVNDVWLVENIENHPSAVVQIFDRWGILVYESFKFTKWDGKDKSGNNLPDGAYYYTISNLLEGNAPISGFINIVR
ncbi:MAG: gliding motility-associated C-terminal domain-containing protein [Bacteroidetes bacterium]|nr:MAG: gliding motility-associated C-terminal domain-containing protein [Bacteroidota bacterium]